MVEISLYFAFFSTFIGFLTAVADELKCFVALKAQTAICKPDNTVKCQSNHQSNLWHMMRCAKLAKFYSCHLYEGNHILIHVVKSIIMCWHGIGYYLTKKVVIRKYYCLPHIMAANQLI